MVLFYLGKIIILLFLSMGRIKVVYGYCKAVIRGV